MTTKILLLTAAALLAGLSPAAARQSSELTLARAIEIGLKNNYDLQVSALQTRTAELNNTWGAAGLYPTVAVGATANYSRTLPQGSEAENYSSTVIQPNAEVSWTLFGGLSVWRTKAKLAAAQEQAEGSESVLIENTVRSIVSAYYLAVVEQEKVAIAERLMNASLERYRREQHAADLGVVRNLELLQAQNAWLQDRASYLSQQNNSENARRQLGFLLALERAADWRLTDSIPPIDDRFNLEELHRIAGSDNTSIRKQYASIKLRTEETLIARSNYYPTLSLGAGASYAYNRTSGIDKQQIQPYVSAKLSFSIFNGGQRRRAVRAAQINQEIEQLTLDELKLSVSYDVDKQYDAYLLRGELVSLREEQLTASELSLRIAERKYADGTMTLFDFRDVQIACHDAAVDLLAARYDLVMAHIDLLLTTGMLLREVRP